MKINKWLAAVLVAACFFSAGCSPMVREGTGHSASSTVQEKDGYYPISIETQNSNGEMVPQTFTKAPERVVCVWQNSIETLFALGVGDRIVAAMGLPSGEYLRPEYRETYEKIPYQSMENLDMETIMMQEPDFIVGWASTFGAKTLRSTDFWESRGVHTYISPGSSSKIKDHTVEYEYQDILNLGKVFHKEKRAQELVDQMEDEIDRAEARANETGHHPKGLIVEYLGKNINVYGKHSLAGNILTSMGGQLMGADLEAISKEQMLEMDPDAIFVIIIERSYGDEDKILDQIYKEKALQNLRCVKEHRVYPLPLYAVYSAGVRTLDGIQIIGKGLYPELYGE